LRERGRGSPNSDEGTYTLWCSLCLPFPTGGRGGRTQRRRQQKNCGSFPIYTLFKVLLLALLNFFLCFLSFFVHFPSFYFCFWFFLCSSGDYYKKPKKHFQSFTSERFKQYFFQSLAVSEVIYLFTRLLKTFVLLLFSIPCALICAKL
jgi:hypothetical protein